MQHQRSTFFSRGAHVCLCLRGVADDNDNELQRDGGRGGVLETVREKQINLRKREMAAKS